LASLVGAQKSLVTLRPLTSFSIFLTSHFNLTKLSTWRDINVRYLDHDSISASVYKKTLVEKNRPLK
jgi:hypothetical protein